MDLFTAMEVSASGLNAERVRMNALASNLANAQTTRTPEGGPYKRIDPVFEAVPLKEPNAQGAIGPEPRGVYLVDVPMLRQDESEPQRIYDPAHPDADASGFVAMPNVNAVEEMVNMITASRSYEAGVSVLDTIKGMARAALSIGA